MESSSDVSKDELEIRTALEKFIVAYENNDEPSMRSLFAPDFVDMSAGEPTRQGEAAIRLMLMRAAHAMQKRLQDSRSMSIRSKSPAT